jgi:flagellar hook-basal body complex protein FliE
MNISGIQVTNNLLSATKTESTSSSAGTSFENMLNQYLQQADGAVKDFEDKSAALAKGDNIDLHEVTIAAQKAAIAVQLTTEIRNKAVEAYQEMMRMQV